MKTVQETLISLNACTEAMTWASDKSTFAEVISQCRKPDWLLWLDEKLNILNDKERRLLACYFVRHRPLSDGRKVWDLLTDERSRNAVRVAERYAHGRATNQELTAARNAAWDTAWTAARATTLDAACDAARIAVLDVARDAAWDAAWDAQAKYILKKYGKRMIQACEKAAK